MQRERSPMTADDGRERSDEGRYVESVTPESVFALFEDSEPRTAKEVGEELGIARRTALNKLQTLAEQGMIRKKRIGAHAVAWWRPVDESDTA